MKKDEFYVGIRGNTKAQRQFYQQVYSDKYTLNISDIITQLNNDSIKNLQLGNVCHYDITEGDWETPDKIRKLQLTENEIQELIHTLQENDSVKILNLTRFKNLPVFSEDLVSILHNHTSIEMLIINHQLPKLSKKWYPVFSHLTALDLSYCHLGNKSSIILTKFLHYISKYPQQCCLKQLALIKNNLRTLVLAKAWKILCQQLDYLNLSYNRIDKKAIVILADCLMEPDCGLHYLDLSGNQLSNANAIHFAKALRHNRSLHKLNLYDNHFNRKTAAYIASACIENKNLVEIYLMRHPVGLIKKSKFAKIIDNQEKFRYDIFANTLDCVSELYWAPYCASFLKRLPIEILDRIFIFIANNYLNVSINDMRVQALAIFNTRKSPTLFFNRMPKRKLKKSKFVDNKILHSTDIPITGRFDYVILRKGKLIIGEQSQSSDCNHVDLARGKAVRNAGQVKFRHGRVKYVDNSARYYFPYGKNARAAAFDAFKRHGFQIRKKAYRDVQERQFIVEPDGYKGVNIKGN